MSKNIEKNNANFIDHGLLKLALTLVLILMLGVLFLLTWLDNYNVLLRFQYLLKGNIFLMIMYMVLIYIFMILFDCNSISEKQTGKLLFSEMLAVISCNILVYLVIITPAVALGFMPIMPLCVLTIIDFLVVAVWCISLHLLFNALFPPKDMLLISNENSIDALVYKFSKRNDLYNIKEKMVFDSAIDDIYEKTYRKCDEYSNVLVGDLTSECRNDIIKYCFNNEKTVYVIPKISDILLKYSDDIFAFDTPIFLSSNFALTPETKIIKRIFDLCISLIFIIVFSPIYLLIAICIKVEDGGPIFFTQKRITQNDEEFNIIKFRSMKVDNTNEVRPTQDNDSRVTKVGKVIRALHLDEIPQFFNVLKGEMSVVGPRPERIEHVELYTKEISEFKYRSKVKAGITGLAQIYGKYNTSAIDKLKLDLIYIKKCSIYFDIELIFRTFNVFLKKESTEGFDINSYNHIKENEK